MPTNAAPCATLDGAPFELAMDDGPLPAPPPIVDPLGTMAPFYEHLVAVARHTATEHTRIAIYGDSNMTMDWISGSMRRVLQERFGDGGHGYVALGRPWDWYRHMDVRHQSEGQAWRLFATSTHPAPDRFYGFANIALESDTAGTRTWVATTDEGTIGRRVARFDVFYLRRPYGGSFDILVDDRNLLTVSTRAAREEAGFTEVLLPDGPHRLACVIHGGGSVRLFGAALERQEASIVVDSLGVGALNFQQMRGVEATTRQAQFARRRYDLVVFLLGTNLFMPEQHEAQVRRVVEDLRAALPNVSILLLSPPDLSDEADRSRSDRRIVAVSKQLEAIASHLGLAFWDFRGAMGGNGSMATFMKLGLAAGDRVHLTHKGGELMGRRFTQALLRDAHAWAIEHPQAGCRVPVPPMDATVGPHRDAKSAGP